MPASLSALFRALPALAVRRFLLCQLLHTRMQCPNSSNGSTSTVHSLESHRPWSPQESAVSSRTSLGGTSFSETTSRSSSSSSVPWWHAEAAQILGGSDLQAIQLLCRLWTCDDHVFLRSCFESNWTATLDIFLWTLSDGTRTRREIDHLDMDVKVEEILQRLRPSSPEQYFPSDWPFILYGTSGGRAVLCCLEAK